MSKTLAEALRLAGLGIPVVAMHEVVNGVCSCIKGKDCDHAGNHPRTLHGLVDATSDAAKIRQWFTRWPGANLAIATGDGVVVVDIDRHEADGMERWAKLCSNADYAPVGCADVVTGGGGHHLYFRLNGAKPRSRNLGGGVEIKAAGACVTVPPSIHKSGKMYEWVKPLAGPESLPEFPAFLLEPPVRVSSDASIPRGERNNTLASLAGKLWRAGISPAALEAALLAENASKCNPPLSDSDVRAIAKSISKYKQGANEEWPDPEPLGDVLLPVPKFSLAWFPASLRPLVEDVADRMQTPQDFPAAAAIVALAGCVGRRAAIRPKAEDSSWVVVPNLWGGIIAPPGMMKSPTLNTITKPLHHIEQMWRAEFDAEWSSFETEKEYAKLRHQAWSEKYKSAVKKGEPTPPEPDKSLRAPAQKRLIVMDATLEKLHEILQENPAGVFVVRDELTGWLAEMERPGREGDRTFHLTAWNGDSGHTVDRIGRGSVYVPAICTSFFGNIQPARLRWYLAQMAGSGPSDDGLFQRFQVMVYPDQPSAAEWKLIDRPPDNTAIATAEAVHSRLANMSADDPVRLRFCPAAQRLFNAWLENLERNIRGSGLAAPLVSHLSKYRSLMPTLAGLFSLANSIPADEGEISVEHTQQAIDLCAYLTAHAKRIYACVASPELLATRELGAHIQAGHLPDTFTTRDVYRRHWSGLDSSDKARGALYQLKDYGWVRQTEAEDRNGRPSDGWQINPKVRRE